MGAIGNKFLIEVGKSEEGTDAFDECRGFSFTDGSQLDRVHSNLSLTNNHTQEFHLGHIKKTLG